MRNPAPSSEPQRQEIANKKIGSIVNNAGSSVGLCVGKLRFHGPSPAFSRMRVLYIQIHALFVRVCCTVWLESYCCVLINTCNSSIEHLQKGPYMEISPCDTAVK